MKELKNTTVSEQNFGAWLIKCNPKVWDFAGAMQEGLPSIRDWSVADNYRSEKMQEDDPVVFWVSGPSGQLPVAGVWGVGSLRGPRFWVPASDDSDVGYWMDAKKANAAGFSIPTDIRLITSERLLKKLSRDRLRQHKILGQMEVIRAPEMANPSFLTKTEFTALNKIIPDCATSKKKESIGVSIGKTGAGFGNPDTNALVEERAMQAVMKYYRRRKYQVKDVSSENLGWDVTVSKRSTKETLNIEVKGVSGQLPKVLLTQNEMNNAGNNSRWKLAVVIDALSKSPKVSIWSAESAVKCGKPFVWQVDLK